MPIYGTKDELNKLRKRQFCAVCGERLDVYYEPDTKSFYLACTDYRRTQHEGFAREVSEYQKKGIEALNIETRRKIMVSQIGETKTRALEKYAGITALTRVQAKEIINTIWPEAEAASPAEVYKAIMLCVQYQLNPLKRHLFLIPFWNADKKRYEYAAVQGIGADRLIASREHDWTFLDDTPRIGTDDEVKRHYGKTADPDRLYCITKMRDLKTRKEVIAWGEYSIYKIDKQGNKVLNHPKGEDKGNSMLNMCCIRSERKGLDMLYPADMPRLDIPVIDERYESFPEADEPPTVTVTDAPKVDKATGEVMEGEFSEVHSAGSPQVPVLDVTKQAATSSAPTQTGQVPPNIGALFNWMKGNLKDKMMLPQNYLINVMGATEADLKKVNTCYDLVRKFHPEWGEWKG